MAKFIKFVNEKRNHNGLDFDEGLIQDNFLLALEDPGGIYFTDTNWFSYWVLEYGDKATYWVYDVEVPDGNPFIAFDNKYKAQNIILSNPRRIWKDKSPVKSDDETILNNINDEFVNTYKNSLEYSKKTAGYNSGFSRTFFAKKNNLHEFVKFNITP
jgi:hypothetical protein